MCVVCWGEEREVHVYKGMHETRPGATPMSSNWKVDSTVMYVYSASATMARPLLTQGKMLREQL